jgi:hypothetical protein
MSYNSPIVQITPPDEIALGINVDKVVEISVIVPAPVGVTVTPPSVVAVTVSPVGLGGPAGPPGLTIALLASDNW